MGETTIGETGSICLVSGIYICKDHPENYIPLNTGERFPACLETAEHKAKWVLRKRASDMLNQKY